VLFADNAGDDKAFSVELLLYYISCYGVYEKKSTHKRIFQQILRDKRTLALLFVAPLFVLTLMYFVFNGNTVNPKLGVIAIPENLINALENADLDVVVYENADNDTMLQEDLDGLLKIEGKSGFFPS